MAVEVPVVFAPVAKIGSKTEVWSPALDPPAAPGYPVGVTAPLGEGP